MRRIKKEDGIPRGQRSIMDAFRRQSDQMACPVCRISLTRGKYQAHLTQCKVADDDDECQVVLEQTAQEKYARNIITLDENSSGRGESEGVHPIDTTESIPNRIVITESVVHTLNEAVEKESQMNEKKEKRRRSRRLRKDEDEEWNEQLTEENSQDTVEEKSRTSTRGKKNRDKQHEQPTKRRRSERLKNCGGSEETAKEAKKKKNEKEEKKKERTTAQRKRTEMIIVEAEKNIKKEPDSCSIEEESLGSNVGLPLVDHQKMVQLFLIDVERRLTSYAIGQSQTGEEKHVHSVYRIIWKVFSPSSPYGSSFWQEDVVTLRHFLVSSPASQTLFVRLFIRKYAWHQITKLNEQYIYLNCGAHVEELVQNGLMEDGSSLADLRSSLELLPLNGVRQIAKKFNVDSSKNKSDMVQLLVDAAHNKKCLFGSTSALHSKILKAVRDELGSVCRISPHARLLFHALCTLYSPTLSDSLLLEATPTMAILSNMLNEMREVETGRKKMAAPSECSAIIRIYANKQQLIEYVRAKESEEEQIRCLRNRDYENGKRIGEEARDRLVNMDQTELQFLSSIPSTVRRFTAHAVYARCVMRTGEILEKTKEHRAAVNWQRFLVDNHVFKDLVRDVVGHLFERIALNLHSHCGDAEEAIDQIMRGLDDPTVPDKNRLTLDDRGKRIRKESWQSRIDLLFPEMMEIYGEVLDKGVAEDSRTNRFVTRTADGTTLASSVEHVALNHFRHKLGYSHGFHSEGSIWHTLFGLFCYDIIFSKDFPDVWLCDLQEHPLDLNSSELYSRRRELFDQRMREIEGSSIDWRRERVRTTWEEHEGEVNSECHWDIGRENVLSLLNVVPPSLLVSLFSILCRDYRHRRSGFPDLVVWDSTRLAVVEVKGPGDSLSTKQRLWLDFFRRQSVPAYVCHVKGVNRRHLS